MKANAYGHGAPEITRVLESWGAVGVAVADVVEGTILRDSGYEGRVLCLGAIHPNALHEESFPMGVEVSDARAIMAAGNIPRDIPFRRRNIAKVVNEDGKM